MKLPLACSVLVAGLAFSLFSVNAADSVPANNQDQKVINGNRSLPGVGTFNADWPGFGAHRDGRLVQFAKTKAKDTGAIVFFGDSITEGWDLSQAFPNLKTANRGISGDTSRGMLGRLPDNVLDLKPQAVVLLCGINDLSQKNQLGTPESIAANIRSMIEAMVAANPQTPFLVCETLPCGAVPAETIRATNAAIAKTLAGFPSVHLVKTHSPFLKPDGSQNEALFKDRTHPNAAGYAVWQAALEPEFAKFAPANTAVIPATKLENDFYDWQTRHAEILKIKDQINPDIVLIGDSITHMWGGQPKSSIARGENVLQTAFAGHRVLNLGFGWDRTQNVLWRLDHGELDQLQPKFVILNIGSNNTSGTGNARQNTPDEIAAGVRAICDRLQKQAPQAKLILMAVFPREEKPDHPRRQQIAEINRRIAEFGKLPGITFIDIGAKFLNPDGTIPRELMSDFCHPTEKGYQIWADALAPILTGK
jgi:lysophospholipase L1-like esterase